MEVLEKRILDSRALTYLREYLTIYRMPGQLLSKLDLEKGEIWTYLSPEISDERAYKFSDSGVAPASNERISLGNGYFATRVNRPSRDIVGDLVEDFIKNNPNGICFFDDRLEGKDGFDEGLIKDDRLTFPILFFENEAYYYVASKNLGVLHVGIKDFFLDRHGGFHALAVLLVLPPDFDLPFTQLREEISLETLAKLMSYTRMIIINAYDVEGYLIWSRP